uniref:Uncharacterized protein n=1 Tax=viral metagenome TaxID=1070528 RepID=A0A6C0BEE0_9ZZZZ
MNQKGELLIFDPNFSVLFVKNSSTKVFEWNGEFIGDITALINKIPAMKGRNLFYFYPMNQYFILQKYDPTTHIIEMIKRIYGFHMIPYNTCIYRKKSYFMYQYVPFNELEYSPYKKKSVDIIDDERKIYILHWLLGVKGKFSRIMISNSEHIFISKGKYTSINYEKNDVSSASLKRFFVDYTHLYNIVSTFREDIKIDKMRSLFTLENYWWFQEIEKRMERIVNIDFAKK